MGVVHIVLWKWQQPGFREVYTYQHVNVMVSMLRRHTANAPNVRIVCITDDPYGIDAPVQTYPLWDDFNGVANATGRHLPSCYRRLKLFDPETQAKLGFKHGDRIISLDLDSVIVGSLDQLLAELNKSSAIFAGWGVRGTYHNMVFNGSFWSFTAGSHLQHVWTGFHPVNSPRQCMAKGYLGSDQAWISMHFAQRKDVQPILAPCFVSYARDIKRTGLVNSTTRIVFFHGVRKPWHREEQRQQPWITNHWR